MRDFEQFLENYRCEAGQRKFNSMLSGGRYINYSLKSGLFTSGLYRYVIIPTNKAYIIKFARRGSAGEYQINRELEVYREAEKENLQNWFARPLGYGNWDKFFYCAFTYVPHIGKVPDMFGQFGVLTKEEFDSCDCEQLEQAQYYIKSKKHRDLLENFCVINEVNDLHEDNFGFSDVKNHIVFTDYAGYGGIPD